MHFSANLITNFKHVFMRRRKSTCFSYKVSVITARLVTDIDGFIDFPFATLGMMMEMKTRENKKEKLTKRIASLLSIFHPF